jgi:hypothetical protein
MDGQLRRASETEAERKEAAQDGLRSSAHFRVGCASIGRPLERPWQSLA